METIEQGSGLRPAVALAADAPLQPGPELGPIDAAGASVALSADGSTALVGDPSNGAGGAAWLFVRTGTTWTQQGPKLMGATGAGLGIDVALSADGDTALVGVPGDDSGKGAVLVLTRDGTVW